MSPEPKPSRWCLDYGPLARILHIFEGCVSYRESSKSQLEGQLLINGLYREVHSITEFGHLPDQLQSGIRNERRAFRKATQGTTFALRAC